MRRGSADEHTNFIGAVGEVTVDTTNQTLRVHDGQTPGGTMLARITDILGDCVVETQLPTAENQYTWYRKYKSGWVEMGGKSNSQEIVLPIEMQSTNYLIQLTGTCTSSNNNVYVFGYRDVTTTSFTTQGNVLNSSGGSAVANTANKNWYVCGFAK